MQSWSYEFLLMVHKLYSQYLMTEKSSARTYFDIYKLGSNTVIYHFQVKMWDVWRTILIENIIILIEKTSSMMERMISSLKKQVRVSLASDIQMVLCNQHINFESGRYEMHSNNFAVLYDALCQVFKNRKESWAISWATVVTFWANSCTINPEKRISIGTPRSIRKDIHHIEFSLNS